MNIPREANRVQECCRSSVRKMRLGLLIGFGLAVAAQVGAVDRSFFIGHWLNVDDQTRGIKAIEIGSQDNQIFMLAWGAFTPNPCRWGQARVSTLASSVSSSDVSAATAVYKPGFKVTRLTMRPGPGHTLIVEVLNHFNDNSGRSDYADTETFRLARSDEWDFNTYR